jgi:SIT family siderophore-iron:H+ symporter-like MFS transporter
MIPSLHSIINIWAAGVIADRIMSGPGWRWGYGVSSIIYPVLAIPLFTVLVWTTLRAKRRGLLNQSKSSLTMIRSPRTWVDLFWQADVIGLIFLAASIALCLIPLTLGGGSSAKWRTAKVLAPFLVGFVVALPGFFLWEIYGARHPLIPFQLLKRRHILLSCLLNMMFTVTGSAQSSYLYFTVVVAFGKGVEVATRISRLTSFVQAIAGVVLGVVIRYYRRPKVFTIIGCVLYLAAYAILYRYRGGHTQSEFAGLVGGEVVLGIASEYNKC